MILVELQPCGFEVALLDRIVPLPHLLSLVPDDFRRRRCIHA